MKRPLLNRRALDGYPPAPVLRDVAPNCETVCLYDDDGRPLIIADLDSRIVGHARRAAKAEGTTFACLFVTIIEDALDKEERGF